MNPHFIHLAKRRKKRIILPESEDIRILKAASFCEQQGIADITLVGESDTISERLSSLNLTVDTLTIIDPVKFSNLSLLEKTLSSQRYFRGLSKAQIENEVIKPLTFANLLVKSNVMDGCVAGATNSSADVIRTARQIIGTKTSGTRLSSFFIMESNIFPTPVLFADCAINISPTALQLADIAYQCANNAKMLLGITPKIALLSFSTNGSGSHRNVDKIRLATALLQEKHPELQVIGDIQFDAACSNTILDKKWANANFQTPANIFIFPNLESGNIAYKVAEQMGGATAIGPIFQGLKKTVNDLSRGTSVEAIINTIAISNIQSD